VTWFILRLLLLLSLYWLNSTPEPREIMLFIGKPKGRSRMISRAQISRAQNVSRPWRESHRWYKSELRSTKHMCDLPNSCVRRRDLTQSYVWLDSFWLICTWHDLFVRVSSLIPMVSSSIGNSCNCHNKGPGFDSQWLMEHPSRDVRSWVGVQN